MNKVNKLYLVGRFKIVFVPINAAKNTIILKTRSLVANAKKIAKKTKNHIIRREIIFAFKGMPFPSR